ncbi:3-oxoadipate--succinyl-CoA transferase subunit B [Rhodopseudomonas sp. P2A-2r]|uniref:CoA-transferase subunit beta n=1 Tax=Rhodopseudomonas sp. P2A-2r TaxID=2991972 RepID=UPI002234D85E|nr:CoA-transferase [Rhodopseudomonas sp. P2A-2r]UZE47862.1 3-oxoadipate--succinyl-CoA transferase subunit B [Rhodopseudomonas sp. P2A-2r]
MDEMDAAPSLGEKLAVLLARDMTDGEKAIIGTNSDIQLAACNLARNMQAPRLWWISGPGGMVNPTRDHLLSTADYENLESAEAWMDLPNMIDLIDWQIHFFDFAILSALQVDRFGNINTVVVGDQHKPRVRGPGTVGISALCGLAKRFYVFVTRHDRSAFVPRVDFLCGAGHMEGGNSREQMGLPPGGPKLVLSPLGVFDFEPRSKAMRVRSVHPGVTLEQIHEATAFDLIVDGTPPVTDMPTVEELRILRQVVDRRGDLLRKFQ